MCLGIALHKSHQASSVIVTITDDYGHRIGVLKRGPIQVSHDTANGFPGRDGSLIVYMGEIAKYGISSQTANIDVCQYIGFLQSEIMDTGGGANSKEPSIPLRGAN